LISLVVGNKGKGVDTQLGEIFTDARRSGLWADAQSAHRSALTKARAKLKWETFESLSKNAVELAYKNFPARDEYVWKGCTVRAIDGSHYTLPASDALRTTFDPNSGLGTSGRSHYPQCLVSTMYDVFRRFPVARTVVPLAEADEREQAVELLKQAPKLDHEAIELLDQGYPSYKFLHILREQERLFIIRCPAKNSFSAIAEFMRRNEPEGTIWLTPSNRFQRSISKLDQMTHCATAIKLRIIRLAHPDGTESVLLTNLFDTERFSRNDIIELYARRWAIENHYRDEKTSLDIEQFHSKTNNGVRQELFAVLVAAVIARTVTALAVDSECTETDKCIVRPQLKNAVMAFARNAALLTSRAPEIALKIFQELLVEIRRVKYYQPKKPRPHQPRVNKSARNKWQRGRVKVAANEGAGGAACA